MTSNRNKKLDYAFAHQTFANHPKLAGKAASQVAVIILKHLNRKTGRCDPSIKRIALLCGGLNEKTVRRSIATLVETRLFTHKSHGGRFHTGSFEPNWSNYHRFVAKLDELMSMSTTDLELLNGVDGGISAHLLSYCENHLQSNRTPMSKQEDFSVQMSGRKCPTNPIEQPIEKTLSTNRNSEVSTMPKMARDRRNATNERSGDKARCTIFYPKLNGRDTSHRCAARQAAARRVDEAMRTDEAYGKLVELVDPESYENAVTDELHQRGSGILTIKKSIEKKP